MYHRNQDHFVTVLGKALRFSRPLLQIIAEYAGQGPLGGRSIHKLDCNWKTQEPIQRVLCCDVERGLFAFEHHSIDDSYDANLQWSTGNLYDGSKPRVFKSPAFSHDSLFIIGHNQLMIVSHGTVSRCELGCLNPTSIHIIPSGQWGDLSVEHVDACNRALGAVVILGTAMNWNSEAGEQLTFIIALQIQMQPDPHSKGKENAKRIECRGFVELPVAFTSNGHDGWLAMMPDCQTINWLAPNDLAITKTVKLNPFHVPYITVNDVHIYVLSTLEPTERRTCSVLHAVTGELVHSNTSTAGLAASVDGIWATNERLVVLADVHLWKRFIVMGGL